jgi:hypothetical protein
MHTRAIQLLACVRVLHAVANTPHHAPSQGPVTATDGPGATDPSCAAQVSACMLLTATAAAADALQQRIFLSRARWK